MTSKKNNLIDHYSKNSSFCDVRVSLSWRTERNRTSNQIVKRELLLLGVFTHTQILLRTAQTHNWEILCRNQACSHELVAHTKCSLNHEWDMRASVIQRSSLSSNYSIWWFWLFVYRVFVVFFCSFQMNFKRQTCSFLDVVCVTQCVDFYCPSPVAETYGCCLNSQVRLISTIIYDIWTISTNSMWKANVAILAFEIDKHNNSFSFSRKHTHRRFIS